MGELAGLAHELCHVGAGFGECSSDFLITVRETASALLAAAIAKVTALDTELLRRVGKSAASTVWAWLASTDRTTGCCANPAKIFGTLTGRLGVCFSDLVEHCSTLLIALATLLLACSLFARLATLDVLMVLLFFVAHSADLEQLDLATTSE